jgi:hypothetical protein
VPAAYSKSIKSNNLLSATNNQKVVPTPKTTVILLS